MATISLTRRLVWYHLTQPVADVDSLVEGTDDDVIRASLIVIARLRREANDLQIQAAESRERVRRSVQAVRQAADVASHVIRPDRA